MKKLKYVMNLDSGHYVILPDNGMNHSSVYRVEAWTSAGFLSFVQTPENGVKVTCWGRSESLNLDSDPRDAAAIERTMNEVHW